MALQEAIHDAMGEPNPQASQDRVHDLVADRLAVLAPRTTIRKTGYFNHSWAPDIVVRDGSEPERWIYLRFDVREPSFEDDLRYLADERPFFLDIADRGFENPTASDHATFVLSAALGREGRDEVLVADVPAIDHLEQGVRGAPDLRTATRQIIRGGRGVVDPDVADSLVESWGRAGSAIDDADGDRLRAALDEMEQFLNRLASLDLESGLRGKWVAAGQPAEAFPSLEDWELHDRAPEEIAHLVLALLDHPEAATEIRWRDIAQAISLSDLGHELSKIGTRKAGGRVNELVKAGMPYWTAQYAYVPHLESDSLLGQLDWSIGGYSVGLNLIRRNAFFTDLGRKWSTVPRTERLPEARPRIEVLSATDVLGVGLVTPEENVSVELRPDATASLGERLEQFMGAEGDSAWRAARMTWLEVRIAGSSAVAHVDFRRSVVRTTEPVPLRSYALAVSKYVAGLDAQETERLTRGMADDDN